MKCAAAVVAVFMLMGVARSFDLTFKDDVIDCGKEMGMTAEEAMDEVKNRGEKVGCIHACVMKRFDAFENGKVAPEKLYAILDENKSAIDNFDNLRGGLVKCCEEILAMGDITECDAAKTLGTCMQPYLPKTMR